MVSFSPLTAQIRWRVLGIPANFNRFRILASLLQWHRSPEANQTLHDVWHSPCLLWPNGRPSQQLLSSCWDMSGQIYRHVHQHCVPLQGCWGDVVILERSDHLATLMLFGWCSANSDSSFCIVRPVSMTSSTISTFWTVTHSDQNNPN